MFRLVAGLGNPGREYADTRHNVGFLVLDRLAARDGATWTRERRWKTDLARAGSLQLCKPLTFMNLSGDAIQSVASFHKIPPAEILIVIDDLALPLGTLRLRPSGSSGGHNGLQSIIDRLGTPAIPRLRIGIGSAAAGTVEHVLGRFTLAEREPLEQSLTRAVEAIDCAQSRGLDAAMNAFN
jgi:PTH1 family peptidyl-tRNA hydrolase